MKAKEYAKQYAAALAAGTTKHEACAAILCALLKEVSALTEARHVKCQDALLAVFKELNNKWQAVCAIHSELPTSGFYSAVEHLMPEVWKDLLFLMPELRRNQNNVSR